ncbi:hypothetical protein [Streptomyces griseorubiginosus]|uniref:hypothetical protein n=1 Tax=Streptomyces griseorubiginosus TaxID=67304 RepID=UPI0036E9C155
MTGRTADGPRLLKRMDWHDNELPYTQEEVLRHEARLARVRQEVADIRRAATSLREAGGRFHTEVADFLTAQARYLESANEADGGVELQPQDDTVEHPVHGITPARRALMLARAWNEETG